MALLNWRNTPNETMNASPSQRFFGRRTKTLLPIKTDLLREKYDSSSDKKKIMKSQESQKKYYDRSTKELPPLQTEDLVRIKPNKIGDKKWKPGVVKKVLEDRKYLVKTQNGDMIRNRVHLRK